MPVITLWDGLKESHCHEVVIYGQDGKEAARIKYDHYNAPRAAKVWIETENKIETK